GVAAGRGALGVAVLPAVLAEVREARRGAFRPDGGAYYAPRGKGQDRV
ncbi:MAG: hypothetical protein AVDCRST_MAG22-3487, partial [uncultured Rubrobacteraceae bacterium]